MKKSIVCILGLIVLLLAATFIFVGCGGYCNGDCKDNKQLSECSASSVTSCFRNNVCDC